MLGKSNTGNLHHRYSNETSCPNNLTSENRTAAKQNKELESSTSYFLSRCYCNVLWAELWHGKNTRFFTELLWPDFGIQSGCEIIRAHPIETDQERSVWRTLHVIPKWETQINRWKSTLHASSCKKSRTSHLDVFTRGNALQNLTGGCCRSAAVMPLPRLLLTGVWGGGPAFTRSMKTAFTHNLD